MHGGHGIRCGGVAFLDAVDVLAGFGEDVGVLRWGKDAIEIGFVKAFTNLEDGVGGCGRCKRQFIRGNADDRPVLTMELDIVLFVLASPDSPCC